MRESTAEKKLNEKKRDSKAFDSAEGTTLKEASEIPTAERSELLRSLKEDPFLSELQEVCAEFFDCFNFKPNLGRLWITLFYSITPLSQRELMQLLDLSAGTVSQSLSELSKFGMIIPIRSENRRETLYKSEHNLAKIASSILGKREKQIIAQTIRKVEKIKVQMAVSVENSELSNLRLQGLEELLAICNLAQAVMTLFDVFSRHSYHAVKLGIRALSKLKVTDIPKWLSPEGGEEQ